MNKIIMNAIVALFLCSCGPSQIRAETIDLNRDSLWNRCSFYIRDHQCGMLTNQSQRNSCVIENQGIYMSQLQMYRVQWLRRHGCPLNVINP